MVHARHATHAFPCHWHTTWVIELVISGADAFECAGQSHVARAGELIVMQPFEAHTGRPAPDRLLEYRSVYPDDALMARCGWIPGAGFGPRIVRDAPLAAAFAGLHENLERDPGAAPAGRALERWLAALIARHAARPHAAHVAPFSPMAAALERARAFMQANAARRVTVAEAGRIAGLSPFHFARRFRRRYGVSPHAYIVSARVERARAMLRAGLPIVEAAIAAGFADQSHMTRSFGRVLGLTPGRYLGGSSFVQDTNPTARSA